MSMDRIGTRYATALFELCSQDLGKAREYQAVLQNIASVFSNQNIRKVMLSPVVKSSMKADILKEIIEDLHPDKILHVFLDTVAESGRVGAIPAISKSLKRLIMEQENSVEATLTTVVEVDESKADELRVKLENITGKRVLLSRTLDQSILGGFVIHIGSSIIDMSLKTKLNAMSKAAVK